MSISLGVRISVFLAFKPSHKRISCSLSFKRSVSTQFVQISDKVRDAIDASRPVVALESAIYTHGFPYPENTALASHLESIVRVNGAVPATIGILDGIARIGLDAEELIKLTASAGQPGVRKVSRRDIAYVCGGSLRNKKLHGGTTVSATALLAEAAGIQVFATGGLGGVHRQGQTTMDISADLTELGRISIGIISSGCKGFLDIRRTLEYLETQGVGVMTFADGRDGEVDFPAFWTRDSGCKSPLTIKDEKEAAAIIYAQSQLRIGSGLVLANPIPHEHSFALREMEGVISQALSDAEDAGSTGSRNTPFVLNRIHELTGGRSVISNRGLVESNVARGTRVAVELSRLRNSKVVSRGSAMNSGSGESIALSRPSRGKIPFEKVKNQFPSNDSGSEKSGEWEVVVAGSVGFDFCCDVRSNSSSQDLSGLQLHTSNPSEIRQSLGGVGRNVAMACEYLGVSTRLCSIVGNDLSGQTVLEMLRSQGLSTRGVMSAPDVTSRTAQYVAINDENKELYIAAADMTILERMENLGISERTRSDELSKWIDCVPSWLVVDSNWSPISARWWMEAGKALRARIAFEPVSVAKCSRVFGESSIGKNDTRMAVYPNHLIDLMTPNQHELKAMFDAVKAGGQCEQEGWFNIVNSFGLSGAVTSERLVALTNRELVTKGIPQQSIQLLPFVPCIVTTLGSKGVLVAQLLRQGDARLTSEEAAPYLLSNGTESQTYVGGVYVRLFPPVAQVATESILSVNGIGDTFLGAVIAGLVKAPDKNIEDLVDFAQRCAVMSLGSKEAVNPEITSLQHNII